MRNSIRLLVAGAAMAASFATAAQAADSATATASVDILSTISVTKTADMGFGTVAVNADGTYILGADGSYSCTAGLVCAGVRNPAGFHVTGTATNIGVAASVDQSSITLTHATDNTKTFTLDNFSVLFPSGNSLVTGSTDFNVGGTLNLSLIHI